MSSRFLLLFVALCCVPFTEVAADTTSLCRKSCSADPEQDPCESPLPVIPRFLLAGQSNAQGFSDQALKGLFNKTVEIVNQRFNEPLPITLSQKVARREEVTEKLREIIGQAQAAQEGPTINEAKLIYRMAGNNKTSSILNSDTILNPHSDVVCSFSQPNKRSAVDCERPVSPIDGETCGGSKKNYFGPELMFAHHFRRLDTKYKNTTFGITKVAVGGTQIKQFTKDSGTEKNYWQSLEDNIRADKGTLEAFFWFQGENDHFPTSISQMEYLTSLKQLVRKVRKEIFKAHRTRWGEEGSPTAKWERSSDVPVVIFELGSWIGNGVTGRRGEAPGSVILAQREFVENDDNAILVRTGTHDNPKKQLSRFYHFDAPSQLIIGHRLADSFKELLSTIDSRMMNTTATDPVIASTENENAIGQPSANSLKSEDVLV